MDMRHLHDCLKSLSQEASELYLDRLVPVLDEAPTPVQFLRDWVGPNKPFLVKNACKLWPKLAEWSSEYLRQKIGDKSVTVAVTPTGYADAIYQNYFVMPHEEKMTFSQFLDKMASDCEDICYIQKQNSNLTDELKELLSDVGGDVPWASEAFATLPDAVNFWMGDGRAVTSSKIFFQTKANVPVHKDHYENIYLVVSGHKDFILHPPTDLPWIPYDVYPPARFKRSEAGELLLEPIKDAERVPWITLDPLRPDSKRYPNYVARTNPVRCRVSAGDALYLPSLWFHHVTQSHGCIAVNYWYDMDYGIKYNYYKFVEMLLNKLNDWRVPN